MQHLSAVKTLDDTTKATRQAQKCYTRIKSESTQQCCHKPGEPVEQSEGVCVCVVGKGQTGLAYPEKE